MRYIFDEKNTTQSRISEIPIDAEIQMVNKHNRQLLIENQIDGSPQSSKIPDKLERIKRNLRKGKKYAKNSHSKIARYRNDYVGDDYVDEEGFPIWQVLESTIPVATINLDSTTMKTEMINGDDENLDYDRSFNEAAFPIAERYPNSRRLFDMNGSKRNLILSKTANPKSKIMVNVQSFEGLNNKMLLPAYRPKILGANSSVSFSYPKGFQRRYNGRKSSSNPYTSREEVFNDRLTGSNKTFLLVPVSKDLYVLKDVQETGVDRIIIPERYKPLERDKDNATSAILSFKAHMHHDVKDVGRAYLPRGDHRLSDENANYLYSTLDSRIPEENANPTVPPSYPDFLYPGVAFQIRPNSIDAVSKIPDKTASPVSDYDNISIVDVHSRGGTNPYDLPPFLLSSTLNVPNYDESLKGINGQPSVESVTKLDDENLFQGSENYEKSPGYNEFGVELTTASFRDTFDTLDDNIYTPVTLENVEIDLTNEDKEVFDMPQDREDDSKFSTECNEDKPTVDFIDDIATRHGAAFDASANKDNTFFSNITCTLVNNAVLNSEGVNKNNQEYGMSVPSEYNNEKLTHSINFDYDNRFIDKTPFSNYSTGVDWLFNTEEYVTSTSLSPDTEWPLKKGQSDVANSRVLLTAIKPLSSELQKLLSAIKLVNRSLSDVQDRLCDKKNNVRSARTEREDRRDTHFARLADKVDRYDSDLSTESVNDQSSDNRRIKIEGVAERNVKIRRKPNDLFLNKLTRLSRKRENSISNSDVQGGRGNFVKKRKFNEGESPKSGDVEGRRLPHSRFNRNLKSLTKSLYEMRVKPMRQFIESGLKRMKRTTTPIARPSRLIKSNILRENNFASRRAQNHQISKSIMQLNKASFFDTSTKKDNSAHFSSNDKRDLTQRNAEQVVSGEISTSNKDKEKKFSPTDPQFYKEATAYLDILRLLDKTEKPYVEYATDVTTQNLTGSLPPLIFTTTEFSALTYSLYFTEAQTITALSTVAEKKEAFEVTESSLYEYVTVTDFEYSESYDERHYTRMAQLPVTLSAFTITMPTTLPLFYTTELTILPIDEAFLTTEIITIPVTVVAPFTTEVTEIPIVIPTIEKYTIEPVMLLTSFLEGMTDITLKITIPAATETLVEETTALIAESVTTAEETVEPISTTSATEIAQSLFVETNMSLYTFATLSLVKTTETELTIKTTTSIIPVSISLAKSPQIETSESTFSEILYKTEITPAIASSPIILERTETILSTSTEVEIATLTPEDESPVTQIEKTITAEETATEIPTTIETSTPTETTIIITESSTTATEISTFVKTTITEIRTINQTLTTAKTPTSIEISTTSEMPTTSTIPTTIETTISILTTFKTPITKGITSAKTITPTETLTPIEIKTTSAENLTITEISTSAKITIITEIPTITEISTFTEISTIVETLTSTIPTTAETVVTTETVTSTEILATTKIPTTKKTTITKAPTITEILSTTKIQIITEIPTSTESLETTEMVISTTHVETTESTFTSTTTPVTTVSIKTTVPTLKLTSTTPLITNTTISEIFPTTIPSTFLTTTKKPVTTFFKTIVPTTATLITSTTSETPNTTLSTLLTEETTASPISMTTASSLETSQTTTVSSVISTTVSTIEKIQTTLPITIVNATVSTAATVITTEILESTMSPVIYFTVTTPTVTKIPITTIVMDTGTTVYKTTLITSSFLTETIESTTFSVTEYEEYYYESTKEKITATSTKERTMIWLTTEKITITEGTTPSYFIETTTEATPLVIETITLSTVPEKMELIEKNVTVTPLTTEEISTLSKVTLTSTETSTVSETETSVTGTSSVLITAVTTTSLLEETTTEITETSLMAVIPLSTTERPEYITILETGVIVTLAPFSESVLSIIITSEMPPTVPEVSEIISILPETVSEEFTTSTTESSPIIYTTTLFIETTAAISVSVATTEETLEAETEYYVTKEPFYKEEYEACEEYETGIPSEWHYYEEYETTTKKRTTVAVKYTKLSTEKATSPPFDKGTTPYKVGTSELTRYSTSFETTLTYTNETSTTATAEISYTEEVTSTSSLETSTSAIFENVTTVEVEIKFTASAASEETESTTTTWLSFGTTEEYTLPPSTTFRIPTEPLEYLTIAPRYTDAERFILPKFVTKPKEIPEIILKRTTTAEEVSTDTEIVEKLTSFSVSPALTTLTEKEAFKTEVTLAITDEEVTLPRITPFITSEAEVEFTTTSKTVGREEQRKQLLQRLDDLKQYEREMAEREEKLKEREKQWGKEKEKRRKMMQREKEKEKNVTIIAGTTEGNVTTTTIAVSITSPVETVGTANLTVSTITETEVASPSFDMFTTSSLVEISTISSETTPFSVTEEITSTTYTTEKTEEMTTEGSTSITYATEETEEVTYYTTEKSTSIIYIAKEEEKEYVTVTSYVTAPMDLYTLGLATIESTTFYTIEEMYTASYVSETTPFSITEETAFTTETTTMKESTFMTYAEETEETVKPYITESTSITYPVEETEKVQITYYVTPTPYVTTSVTDSYSIGLPTIQTTTPYTIEETYTTSYVTFYSEPLFVSPTITSPITSTIGKFVTLPIATFSERFEEVSPTSVSTPAWYTAERYTAIYTDIYGKPLFTSPALEFTSTTVSSTLVIITTTEIKYEEIEEEIERLKEELRWKERKLEEREKILLEREKKLERDIKEFEKYMEEFEKKKASVTSSKKSTVLTSLSTPVPPTERTTVKVPTTQIKRITEKKENQMTTKMVTSQHTKIKDIEEEKRTNHTPKKTITQEEEIVTKRICLNVLENTTIPLDKRRRDIETKKICLPYIPERNEEKSVGRLSRKLLALQSTRKIKRPKRDVPLDLRYRGRIIDTTRKIDNLQLSRNEWLSNETTKPLRHFKGFARIYKKINFQKTIKTNTDMQRNMTDKFLNRTPLYEQRVLDHKSFFQPTAISMLDNKEDKTKNAFFRYNLISEKRNNFLTDDKASIQKRDVSLIENNERFWSKESRDNISNQKVTTATTEENGFYTVNVLHLNYNEDKQTHEVLSTKPNKDKLTAILSESNDIYRTEFGKKITTPYYEVEEKDEDLEEDELSEEAEKKIEDEKDYIEDLIEDYMNYKENETSTQTQNGRFKDDRVKDKKMTENERKLLDQAWPIEKSMSYHLGGTRFWELDFVTEPSAALHTIDKNKTTIDVSNIRTTCFDVILKNETGEAKSNVSYHKRNIHNNEMEKQVSIDNRSASLKNVTRKNALRNKLKMERARQIARKLRRDSQRSHEPNDYKRSFEEERTVKFNDFRRTSNEDLITAKKRKLCGVNANKLKRQSVKHKDATNKHKKKQPAKSQTLQNVTNLRSIYNTGNCVANKKSNYRQTTTANQVKTTNNKKANEKLTHSTAANHKAKPRSRERKLHNCFNCICDVVNVISDIRSLLDRISFPLDEIKALNCSKYKDIQDKIVITTDSDMEETREFPQPHYNIESLKGQKYIKLEELEDNFKSDLEFDSDYDIVSLPGLNLNLPCNRDSEGITWLSSVSRPSYTWKRADGIALFGFVAENGDLELRNVNAKDTGNYTCVMTHINPDNEEPVETAYEIHLQVVTLPRYIVHGENRYHVRSCDERDLDALVTYLPLKLNSVICEADFCNAYVLTPTCSRSQITINILLVPSHIVKLMMIDPKRCNVVCLKTIQDKLSLILSTNLQIFLRKTIIFRLPHYEQRLVPVVKKSPFARRKRGKTDTNVSAGRSNNVGLFSSCPAGYGLRDIRCVPCNVGTYSEDGVSHCKKCPPGTYQPNHGARVCRTCTNPMTKGCYNMLWNSFSAVMVTLASIGAMLSICLLLLWLICCAKKKFCIKRIAGVVTKEDSFEKEKYMEEQPLIKDEDQQWYRIKKKKGKFYLNKKRRKQNERRKCGKTHVHDDEWELHRTKNAPVISPGSYQSHEDYNNHYPKRSHRRGPQLPECDFDT
ncbi:uncharacterized protein LOC105831666 isoform X2 [Monomorium pharaonis]|uniref:uncharacterized protein LOC105831666 isoform X2 n=1 Tax=Monomorium pharaonis TaxID=307658 RepID=UPI001745FEA2|nr:uncharacterized protein LOC105831666 isoform X2 [Monomorium pharaonis]